MGNNADKSIILNSHTNRIFYMIVLEIKGDGIGLESIVCIEFDKGMVVFAGATINHTMNHCIIIPFVKNKSGGTTDMFEKEGGVIC